MAEIRGGSDSNQRDLKKADSRKSQGNTQQTIAAPAELRKINKRSEHDQVNNVRVKKKIPLAVDIISGILMLAIVCAVIIGSYMLFRYYSDDYDGVDLTYTVAFDTSDDLGKFIAMKNEEVFVDNDKNTEYFGKIIGVETADNGNGQKGGRVYFTVKANAEYRKGEGYSLGGERLAVGSVFKLRCIERNIDVTVVELTVGGK